MDLTIEKQKIGRPIVSLFPYQIKNRKKFYYQNHPTMDPNSFRFDDYWDIHEERAVEGMWVDDDGTWVYMTPKLYFYINLTKIREADTGKMISPWLRDIEWIIFTYIMCTDGFSGFEDDEEYTCQELVGRIERKEDIDPIEMKGLSKFARKVDGTYKKYINAWDYLTKHYLLENPQGKPLGQPIYDNTLYNGIMFSGRGIGKTMSLFVGDYLHQFLFGAVKTVENLDQVNNELKFFIGAADASQLQRSWNNVRSIYYNMPGKYKFSEDNIYYGPFFKNIQGSWNVKSGARMEHLVKTPSGKDLIKGSSAEIRPIIKENLAVSSGDRFRGIYVEEVGLIADIDLFYSYNKDSMIVSGRKVGRSFYLGTAGNLETITKPKKIFDNPEGYEIFGIPNYWRNIKKKVGLFIPSPYKFDQYRDENGNTDLVAAYAYMERFRAKLLETSDSLAYDKEVMNNPFEPIEMMIPSKNAILPAVEAREQISNLETYDIFKNRALIGQLKYNPMEPTGIEFEKDFFGKLRPILYWNQEQDLNTRDGAFIMYEQPPQDPPPGMYYVIYDPAAKDGEGSSLHSLLVYKHTFGAKEGSISDGIVAEWIGRKDTLDTNFELVIMVAKYFNAKIFPETNVAGFVQYCNRNGHFSMLEPDAHLLKLEINGGKKAARDYHKVGYQINGKREKVWCLRKYNDWLLEVKRKDPITGVPLSRNIHQMFSLRCLDEVVHYNDDDNFDHTSSMLGLMLLIYKLSEYPIRNTKKVAKQKYYTDPEPVRKRADILNY